MWKHWPPASFHRPPRIIQYRYSHERARTFHWRNDTKHALLNHPLSYHTEDMEETTNYEILFDKLIQQPENEVVEFKKAENQKFIEQVGPYVSALSNEANLRGKAFAWLIFGVKDKSRCVVGTKYAEDPSSKLKHDIARDTTYGLTIREQVVISRNGKKALMLQIPAAPSGIPIAWKRIFYGRDGESLFPLSIDKMEIIRRQNQIPDWSSSIEAGASLRDLEPTAIKTLKRRYAEKQHNPDFLSLSDEHVLRDLHLINDKGITRAALVLLGTEDAIREYVPNAVIRLEYRETEAEVEFRMREEYNDCFYSCVERLWHDINVRNGAIPIQEGPYIISIPYFNEKVIREALCNAVAHRDYTFPSEIVIKQYPQKIVVISGGGFPKGVDKDHLIETPSTPRNRLLADVLAKTGLVERSGQGIDKIYRETLSEGKPTPDYSRSSDLCVELHLSAIVENKAFALFIKSVQQDLPDEQKLSALDIFALNRILNDDYEQVNRDTIKSLVKRGLVEKKGKTKGTSYILSRQYYDFTDNGVEYFKKREEWDETMTFTFVTSYLLTHQSAKMKDFAKLFENHLSRKQVRTVISGLVASGILSTTGKGAGTRYVLTEKYFATNQVYAKALRIGLKTMLQNGELAALTGPDASVENEKA